MFSTKKKPVYKRSSAATNFQNVGGGPNPPQGNRLMALLVNGLAALVNFRMPRERGSQTEWMKVKVAAWCLVGAIWLVQLSFACPASARFLQKGAYRIYRMVVAMVTKPIPTDPGSASNDPNNMKKNTDNGGSENFYG